MSESVKSDGAHSSVDVHLEVAGVLADYARHVDAADIDAVAALFHPNASVDYGPHHRRTGRDDIAVMFGQMLSSVSSTSHHISNLRTSPDGERVNSQAYVMAWHLLADSGERMDVYGRYDDVLVRLDGRLVIVERVLWVHGSTHRVPFNKLQRGPHGAN